MTDLMGLLVRELSSRYRVSREIGKGGMATVFLAEDLKHDRTVALKVLLPALASAVGPDRFLQEIRIASNLRHPNILPLLDSGEVEGLPFYVMPYIEGESLRARLTREKQLPVEEAVQIGREVADALSYAHGKGVVHRDIKPANIMLDSGHAVVADFGIALATHHASSNRLTASGVSPGSPQYMSPEQAAGDAEVDGRSDIYSLGCVLYEALSGDPPFTARMPQAIFAKKMREPPPRLRVVRDSAPEALEEIVTRSLARTPADRFRTAAELVEALEAVAEGRAVPSVPGVAVPAHRRIGPAVTKWASWLASTTVIGLGLLTAIGFLTTRVYDVKMGIPPEYCPTRSDFPLVGLQAVIPHLYWALWIFLGYITLRYGWRVASYGLHKSANLGHTLDSLRKTSLEAWRKAWKPLNPTTVADVFFLAAFLVGAVVLGQFWGLLSAMWEPEIEILSYANRPVHKTFTFVLTLLIVALLFAWRGVFTYLRRKGPIPGRASISRWGSLVWILVLLISATLPWRMLWNSYHERALLDGEQAYILVETSSELVIYQPKSHASNRYQKQDGLSLQRLGSLGYVFEEPEVFERQEPVW